MLTIVLLWTKLFLHGLVVQSCSFIVKCVFMHDKVPFHVSKLDCEFLSTEDLHERRLWSQHVQVLI